MTQQHEYGDFDGASFGDGGFGSEPLPLPHFDQVDHAAKQQGLTKRDYLRLTQVPAAPVLDEVDKPAVR